ncbi:MAG: response regulator [Deltaproteobacteria bacterium]|nr:response regulator [Deltaproteobacteria bacterium]
MMEPPRLRVLVILAREEEASFVARVLADHGDRPSVMHDVTTGLASMQKEAFDLAIVSLSLPRGDGLAFVHHVRALHPETDVVVVASRDEIAESGHAMALGVLTTVMRPLTGDALLVAADRARERRLLLRERARLAAEGGRNKRRAQTYARCAAFVSETDASVVASRILEACAAELPLGAGAIYIPLRSMAGGFIRAASTGDETRWPAAPTSDDLDDLDPVTGIVSSHGSLRLSLVGPMEVCALVDLVPQDAAMAADLPEACAEALETVAALGTAALVASGKAEAIARTGIKDPETSAYTFAYFGDVAGREIDRAARHDRRFTLMTVAFDGLLRAGVGPTAGSLLELQRRIVDAVLSAVRDSDVVARVDDEELYLLLPEAGLLGALAARRRVLAALQEAELSFNDERLAPPAIGVAVYPTDGADLGRLLRTSRRRAEREQRGVARRLELDKLSFWERVDVLLGGEDDALLDADGRVAMHSDLERTHDEVGLSRHGTFTPGLLARVGAALASDALRHDAEGSFYVAGDAGVAAAVTLAAQTKGGRTRVWVLGREASGSSFELRVDDERLDSRIFLLSATELGAYALLARRLDGHSLIAFQSADLFLVDGLVESLRERYHLQPEAPR